MGVAVYGVGTAHADEKGLHFDGWHTVSGPSKMRYRVLHSKVIELAELSQPCGLKGVGPTAAIRGKVVKNDFDDGAIIMKGLVIESDSGSRVYINVDVLGQIANADMADRGWIIQGLQILLRNGNYVEASAQMCGASGSVMDLDAILLAEGDKLPSITPNPVEARHHGNTIEIPLAKEAGTLLVPVTINNVITLNFTLDSGASDVSLPADVFMTLMRTGSITQGDLLSKQIYILADGSRVPSQTFRIRSLKVGDKVLENVTGSVADVKGSLLLGQSFLSRFKGWSIDNERQMLLLQ